MRKAPIALAKAPVKAMRKPIPGPKRNAAWRRGGGGDHEEAAEGDTSTHNERRERPGCDSVRPRVRRLGEIHSWSGVQRHSPQAGRGDRAGWRAAPRPVGLLNSLGWERLGDAIRGIDGPLGIEDGRLRKEALGLVQPPRLHGGQAALGCPERVDGREQRACGRDHLLYALRSEAQMLTKQPVPEAGDGCLDTRVAARLDREVALGIEAEGAVVSSPIRRGRTSRQ